MDIYRRYLRGVYETYSSGDATEPSYYPALKSLLKDYLQARGEAAAITVQPKRTEVGIPDFRLTSEGNRIIGYIEAKDPATKEQAPPPAPPEARRGE